MAVIIITHSPLLLHFTSEDWCISNITSILCKKNMNGLIKIYSQLSNRGITTCGDVHYRYNRYIEINNSSLKNK